MAVVYVDNVTGSDSNDGLSLGAAKATIAAGCTAAGANGTVHVRNTGTSYNGRDGIGTLPVQPSAAGQTIQGYFDGSTYETPTITGTAPSTDAAQALYTNQLDSITFSHFILTTGLGVFVQGNAGGTAGNCIVEYITAERGDTGGASSNPAALVLDGNTTNYAPNNTIRFCTFTGADASINPSNPQNCRTVFIDHQTNLLMHNCTFIGDATHPSGVGIKHRSNNVTIRHCYFRGFTQYGFQMTTEAGTLNTFDLHNNVFNVPAAVLGAINPTTSQVTSDWQFYNNTIYGLVGLNPDLVTIPSGYWRFYNNIVSLLADASNFYIDHAATALSSMPTDFIYDYNMYWRSASPNGSYFRQNNAAVNLATWQALGQPVAGMPDPGSTVSTDPSLSSPGGTDVTNYRPVAGSAAFTFGHVGGVSGGAQTYAGAYSSASADDVGNITASSSSSNVTMAATRTLYVLRRSQGFRRR